MSRLRVEQISYLIKEQLILKQFSLTMGSGLHVVLGANGAGKSTLLSLLAGDLKTHTGRVEIDDKSVADYSLRELASRRAVLTQENPFGFPLSVREVCGLGCLEKNNSEKLINEVLDHFQLSNFASKKFNELSGGEKQRVHLARIFCQQTDFLFLDEPLNHLDIQYQLMMMKLLKDYASKGKVIVCVLHDIQLALRFSDSISILKKGELIFQGELKGFSEESDKQILSNALSDAFDINLEIDKEGLLRVLV